MFFALFALAIADKELSCQICEMAYVYLGYLLEHKLQKGLLVPKYESMCRLFLPSPSLQCETITGALLEKFPVLVLEDLTAQEACFNLSFCDQPGPAHSPILDSFKEHADLLWENREHVAQVLKEELYPKVIKPVKKFAKKIGMTDTSMRQFKKKISNFFDEIVSDEVNDQSDYVQQPPVPPKAR